MDNDINLDKLIKEIEELRVKLGDEMKRQADYNEANAKKIMEMSQELDALISEFIKIQSNKDDKK